MGVAGIAVEGMKHVATELLEPSRKDEPLSALALIGIGFAVTNGDALFMAVLHQLFASSKGLEQFVALNAVLSLFQVVLSCAFVPGCLYFFDSEQHAGLRWLVPFAFWGGALLLGIMIWYFVAITVLGAKLDVELWKSSIFPWKRRTKFADTEAQAGSLPTSKEASDLELSDGEQWVPNHANPPKFRSIAQLSVNWLCSKLKPTKFKSTTPGPNLQGTDDIELPELLNTDPAAAVAPPASAQGCSKSFSSEDEIDHSSYTNSPAVLNTSDEWSTYTSESDISDMMSIPDAPERAMAR